MNDSFYSALEQLVEAAPAQWVNHACKLLCSFPATAAAGFICQRVSGMQQDDLSGMERGEPPLKLPVIGIPNKELAKLLCTLVQHTPQSISWPTLGYMLHIAHVLHRRKHGNRTANARLKYEAG